jgi:hypothetical protein
MPRNKSDTKEFDPNSPTPKEVDFQITPEDEKAYRAYEKKRLLETDNPTIIDRETWVRINRR